MTIVRVEKVEDCFDGSSVYRYWLDRTWTREDILGLQALGELEYFADFPRPFFRLHCPDGMQAKGVEGEDNCQAVFPSRDRETIRERLEAFLQR